MTPQNSDLCSAENASVRLPHNSTLRLHTLRDSNARCNMHMLPSDTLSGTNLVARHLATHYLGFSAALVKRPSCPGLERRLMPSGVFAASLVSTSWDQPGISSRASNCALPAKINSAREKRQTLRLRTANLTARASRQNMDSSADVVSKPTKQVSLACPLSLCCRL